MATAWGGADPVEQVDGNDYELGTELVANADLTITHIRVWSGAGEVAVTNRRGRIWSTGGGQLGIATLTDNLTPGWSTHALDTPVERLAGQRFVVSYSTGGNYGALVDALATSNVNSGDGNVTALATGSATNGNGVFNTTPGQFPATSPAAHPFYGADVVYTLGVGGNTAPRITAATVTMLGAVATAVIVAEDDETLAGATYRYDWGDGSPVTSSAASSAQHTYTASGLFGVLLSVTDADGLDDFAAAAAEVVLPTDGLDVAGVLDAVVSHALASGLFEVVNGHEPTHAPPGGGLTAAVWAQVIGPVPQASGLALTSGRLELTVRLYSPMTAQPADAIDPALITAVSTLLAAYSADFDLGEQVRNVDLLGATGTALSAKAGYVPQDGQLLRVMDITVPLVINDIWSQHR